MRKINGKYKTNMAINEIVDRAAQNIALGGFTSEEQLYNLIRDNVGNYYDLIIKVLNRMVYIYEESLINEAQKSYTGIRFDDLPVAPNISHLTSSFSMVLNTYNITIDNANKSIIEIKRKQEDYDQMEESDIEI